MGITGDRSTWPRVTQILRDLNLGPDLSQVPEHHLEAARARGSALHEAIELHGLGLTEGLDLNGCAGHFKGYERWVAEVTHDPIVSEFKVAHARWKYVGRLDRVGWQDWPTLGRRRTLYDFKSGERLDLKPVAYQLTLYRMAWEAMRPTEPIARLVAVQFTADGRYRQHVIEDPEAEQVVQAALVVWWAGGGTR